MQVESRLAQVETVNVEDNTINTNGNKLENIQSVTPPETTPQQFGTTTLGTPTTTPRQLDTTTLGTPGTTPRQFDTTTADTMQDVVDNATLDQTSTSDTPSVMAVINDPTTTTTQRSTTTSTTQQTTSTYAFVRYTSTPTSVITTDDSFGLFTNVPIFEQTFFNQQPVEDNVFTERQLDTTIEPTFVPSVRPVANYVKETSPSTPAESVQQDLTTTTTISTTTAIPSTTPAPTTIAASTTTTPPSAIVISTATTTQENPENSGLSTSAPTNEILARSMDGVSIAGRVLVPIAKEEATTTNEAVTDQPTTLNVGRGRIRFLLPATEQPFTETPTTSSAPNTYTTTNPIVLAQRTTNGVTTLAPNTELDTTLYTRRQGIAGEVDGDLDTFTVFPVYPSSLTSNSPGFSGVAEGSTLPPYTQTLEELAISRVQENYGELSTTGDFVPATVGAPISSSTPSPAVLQTTLKSINSKVRVLTEQQRKDLEELARLEKEQAAILQQLAFLTRLVRLCCVTKMRV